MTKNLYCILKSLSRKLDGVTGPKEYDFLVGPCPRALRSCRDCWIAVRKRELKGFDL